ncbi:methyltransferase domain-containing protein [Sulfurirhabdus autotrophica]|uniref:Tellurite methyltransferase n=1 Tax=Sulfurirhabdus autotrophica TaxID=1706046 RepID=A0A4R3YDN5_9PROT|nr:methyltransferase domain-containing protein [Sulfurirhabdus autotrophica]TCV90237.1 tellurite methyltransferase [Sulfurirhabdus autotrophica]
MIDNTSVNFFDTQFQRQIQQQEFALNQFEQTALEFITGDVLDLGCGLGNLSVEMALRGHSVVAVDASQSAIEHIAKIATEKHLPIETIKADLATFHIPQKFDSIVAIGLLMFFPKTRALEMLSDIQSNVLPGGVAVINVLTAGTDYTAMFHPGHYYLFTREELEKHFNGWKIRFRAEHTFPAPDNTKKEFITIVAEKLA